MPLSPELLEILRCPESKGELVYFPNGLPDGFTDGFGGSAGASDSPFLLCPISRLRYPVDEHDLPVMLIEEAIRLEQAEIDRLLAHAREHGLTK